MKPYRCLVAFLLFALVSSEAHARSERCHAANERQIEALFDGWNAALKTGDPKKVVAKYAGKSILLPTLSNKPRLTPEEKEDYFEHFIQGKQVGTIKSHFIEIDCNK